MPLIRLLILIVPIARRLLRDPKVRAKLGLDGKQPKRRPSQRGARRQKR